MSGLTPNEWGVTFAVSDEAIDADLHQWNWGDATDPISVAKLVLGVVREQTMASLEDDGDTIEMGLCEFAMPLRVSLAELVEDWIDSRMNFRTGELSEEYLMTAHDMVRRLDATVARLRAVLERKPI